MPDDTETAGAGEPQWNIIQTTALDPAARDDPHSRLKALRQRCPVMRDEPVKSWFLTRYADVRQTVNDASIWRASSHAEDGALLKRPPEQMLGRQESILTLDNPDHARVRPPLAQAFYGRINRMKLRLEEVIDEVIDALPSGQPFDLMSDVAIPVPILVIAHVLGVEPDRRREFRDWSEAVILSLNPFRSPEQAARAEWGSAQLTAYFTDLMAMRRASPQEDLISDMVKLQADGAALSDDEVRVNLSALLVGGNLTTTDLIGNGVWLLLTHPEEWRKLTADPAALSGSAVEEILRFEGPVAITSRVTEAPRQVCGREIPAGQLLITSLHGANRDPEVFEEPDHFDITRKRAPHVAFGGGAHICIGAPLARLEAKRALQRLAERFPALRLTQTDPPKWRTLPFFRGIESLTVVGEPSRSDSEAGSRLDAPA
ncbi:MULTISPECIES: cytochrome P450 [Phenylobacterium]|jgi:cytochrome P450|nr:MULTISPECIES: cytochrome P450 [Phenylobacterium]